MAEFIRAISSLSSIAKRINRENFTIPDEVMFKSNLDMYEEFRTGTYSQPDSEQTERMKVAKVEMLKKDFDVEKLLKDIPKSDVESFIRNFEKDTTTLSNAELASKIKVTEFLSMYTSGAITASKANHEEALRGNAFVQTEIQKTLFFEFLDSINMIVHSVYKACLFEQSRRKYISNEKPSRKRTVKKEGFTEEEDIDKIIIDLQACESALKKASKCPACKEADNSNTAIIYGLGSLVVLLAIISLYLAFR